MPIRIPTVENTVGRYSGKWVVGSSREPTLTVKTLVSQWESRLPGNFHFPLYLVQFVVLYDFEYLYCFSLRVTIKKKYSRKINESCKREELLAKGGATSSFAYLGGKMWGLSPLHGIR